MKKVYHIYILLLFIISFFLYSCGAPVVYKPNNIWYFKAKRTNDNRIDTLEFRIYDENWQIIMKKCRWDFPPLRDSLGNIIKTDFLTGILDIKFWFPLNLFFASKIDFPPPEWDYLKYTWLLPHKIKFPITIGQTIKWNETLGSKRPPTDEFYQLKVSGTVKVIGKKFYSNSIVHDTCWLLEAKSKSKLGEFNASYFFHEKLGFVYMFYNFIKYQVELELIDLKSVERKI